ncbi:MAG: hypothetical protein WBL86_21250, partial [Pseudolabrys sp.]
VWACEPPQLSVSLNRPSHPPTFLTSDAQHIELADEIAEYDGTVAGCIEFRNRSVKLASTSY